MLVPARARGGEGELRADVDRPDEVGEFVLVGEWICAPILDSWGAESSSVAPGDGRWLLVLDDAGDVGEGLCRDADRDWRPKTSDELDGGVAVDRRLAIRSLLRMGAAGAWVSLVTDLRAKADNPNFFGIS